MTGIAHQKGGKTKAPKTVKVFMPTKLVTCVRMALKMPSNAILIGQADNGQLLIGYQDVNRI